MIHLNFGNVLLKPSHRKQLLSQLRRAIRLGQRVGKFVMSVSLRRSGRMIELVAQVSDAKGKFACRTRRHDWKDAIRELASAVIAKVHAHRIATATA